MSLELSFALLGAEHVEEVCRIDQASFSHPWSREGYQKDLGENPLAHYLGCFHQGELIAFAGMWLVVDEGQISNVAVAPEWRRQGVGRQLMEQMIVLCLALGGASLDLEVRAGNIPAQELYRSLGFVTVGQRRGYYTQPNEDAVLMRLDLPTDNGD